MRRVGSIREVVDISLELPAGAVPYEDFDFEPYFEEARHEEELRKTWRVFTKVKDVLDNGRRLENASWRLWFKERRNYTQQSTLTSGAFSSTAPAPAAPAAPAPPPPIPPPAAPPPGAVLSAVAIPVALPVQPQPQPSASTSSYSSSLSSSAPPPASTPPRLPKAEETQADKKTTMYTNDSSSTTRTAQDEGQQQAPPVIPPPTRPPKQVPSDSSLSSLERYDMTVDANLRRAEEETDRMVGDMFGGVGQRFHAETLRQMERAKAERTRALMTIADRHSLPDAAIDDILAWAHSFLLPATTSQPDDLPFSSSPAVDTTMGAPMMFGGDLGTPGATPMMSNDATTMMPNDATFAEADESELLPNDSKSARAYLSETKHTPRPRVAAFSHSLERNGANNFLLYLIRELRDDMLFTLVSPKEGAMRADYEALGVRVVICSMKLPTYNEDIRTVLSRFEYAIANTIMTTEVVNAAADLNVPCLWIIHEAWPRDQFDYYAKEVFMMSQVDSKGIVRAFKKAAKIVFPARVQHKCYQGLFEEGKAKVIYNGIPLASINSFRLNQNRKQVRAELGYTDEHFVVLHMGTVCRRKGQLTTCEAFGELRNSFPGRMKLLMVGARYIRPHEIEYIDECRATLEADDSLADTTILNVKKNVLPYYLAADVVVCPSMNEVLPLVLCEAMAFERPVIASRIDGIPEAIDDGVEGLLIETGNVAQLVDAVEVLVNDGEKRKKMGAAGRYRVLKQFSFDIMSKTYRETIGDDLSLDLTRPNNNVAVNVAF